MQPRARIIDFIPDMYRTILPAFFEQPLAEERHSTCERCAMCPPEEQVLSAGEYFTPGTKCCTYHPLLPNYAVGGLLRDESAEGAEGRRRIRDKIVQRTGVTPMGILPSPKHRLLYRHGKQGFGKSKALVCPYLDQEHGACTVWKFREAMCTTWFCKHNNGEDGLAFWTQLRDYLIGTQLVLSSHALRELAWDADKILTALPRDLELDSASLDDAPPSDPAYARLWGDWLGREEELYVRAYEVMCALDNESFERLGGVRLSLDLDRLQKRHRNMHQPQLPDPLLKNPKLHARRAVDGSYVLVSYSGRDPSRLRKTVYDLLDYFDGRRPTREVRAAILADTGLTLADSLITKLYQHRVVIDPATSII